MKLRLLSYPVRRANELSEPVNSTVVRCGGHMLMEDLELTRLDDQRGWTSGFWRWLPRLAMASLFFFIGKSKFGAQSNWIKTFEQIGFGQWLRYLAGGMQMLGAIAILIPRLFLVGIAILAATMGGAMLAWIFVLGVPFNAMFPGALLLGLLVLAANDFVDLFSTRSHLAEKRSAEQIIGRRPGV